MKTTFLLLSAALCISGSPVNFSSAPVEKNSAAFKSVQTAEFGSFRVHRQGKFDVTAVWTLSVADGVTGFTVQRTYQDPTDPYSYWEDIGAVSYNPTRSFKYTDENVLAGVINYRIVALIADGSSVTSDYDGIRILVH